MLPITSTCVLDLTLNISSSTTLASIQHPIIGDAPVLIAHKILNLVVVMRPVGRPRDLLVCVGILLLRLGGAEDFGRGWDVFCDCTHG